MPLGPGCLPYVRSFGIGCSPWPPLQPRTSGDSRNHHLYSCWISCAGPKLFMFGSTACIWRSDTPNLKNDIGGIARDGPPLNRLNTQSTSRQQANRSAEAEPLCQGTPQAFPARRGDESASADVAVAVLAERRGELPQDSRAIHATAKHEVVPAPALNASLSKVRMHAWNACQHVWRIQASSGLGNVCQR